MTLSSDTMCLEPEQLIAALVCRSRYEPTAQHQSEAPYFLQSLKSSRITPSYPALIQTANPQRKVFPFSAPRRPSRVCVRKCEALEKLKMNIKNKGMQLHAFNKTQLWKPLWWKRTAFSLKKRRIKKALDAFFRWEICLPFIDLAHFRLALARL